MRKGLSCRDIGGVAMPRFAAYISVQIPVVTLYVEYQGFCFGVCYRVLCSSLQKSSENDEKSGNPNQQ